MNIGECHDISSVMNSLGISPKCFTNYKVGHPCGEIKIGEALVKNKLIPNTKGKEGDGFISS